MIRGTVFADARMRHKCIKLGLGKDACMKEYVDEFREYVRSGGEENYNPKHLKKTFATLAVSPGKC